MAFDFASEGVVDASLAAAELPPLGCPRGRAKERGAALLHG
jgi:hypothetical protein